MLISDIINFLKNDLDKTDITLNQGASDALVSKIERFYNITLPDDIKDFYKFSNGFLSEEDTFYITPLEEIIDFSSLRNNKKFYIAEYLTYCDMWRLEVNPKAHNHYTISCIYRDGIETTLTKSFAEFLTHFLKGGVFEKDGLYDWHDEIRLTKGLPIYNTTPQPESSHKK
jgi:hypothetical protein